MQHNEIEKNINKMCIKTEVKKINCAINAIKEINCLTILVNSNSEQTFICQ